MAPDPNATMTTPAMASVVMPTEDSVASSVGNTATSNTIVPIIQIKLDTICVRSLPSQWSDARAPASANTCMTHM